MAQPIYDKSTRELFHEFVEAFKPPDGGSDGTPARKPLQDGGTFKRNELLDWFAEHYPILKRGTLNAHLIVMSTNAPSRVHHRLRPNGADDLLFQIDSKTFRLYDPDRDPAPIYPESDEDEGDTDESDVPAEVPEGGQEFAYERDLQNYLAKNLHIIRPGLNLYEDEVATGIEYPVDSRRIDILAVEGNDFVVIELKVSKGYDRAVGQILRYMGWIKQNLAEPGQNVKGIIIARKISNDIRLAVSMQPQIELFEYELSIALRPIAGF